MKQKTEIVYILFRVTPSVGQLRSTMCTMRGVSSGVHTNSVHELPSDSGKLSIFNYNARSILPKLDNLAATYLVSSPDIVCVVEYWLCSDICDSEISLVDYSLLLGWTEVAVVVKLSYTLRIILILILYLMESLFRSFL